MNLFDGLCVATITPFTSTGIDESALKNIINFQQKNGVDAFLALGTTGEPSTMSKSEKRRVIEIFREQIPSEKHLIINTGSNCTATAIENSIEAESCGADALLVVTPYYNKCTQDGVYQHFKAIKSSVSVPVILYNVPSRTGVNVSFSTIKRLCDEGIIDGIKESSGNFQQIQETSRLFGNKIKIYCGDDSFCAPSILMGCHGAISVCGNVVPDLTSQLVKYSLQGKTERARKMQFDLQPLISALFTEVNPIPIKAAMSILGLCDNKLRLPLTTAENETYERLKYEMKSLRIV